jgi:hypothetical protein
MRIHVGTECHPDMCSINDIANGTQDKSKRFKYRSAGRYTADLLYCPLRKFVILWFEEKIPEGE